MGSNCSVFCADTEQDKHDEQVAAEKGAQKDVKIGGTEVQGVNALSTMEGVEVDPETRIDREDAKSLLKELLVEGEESDTIDGDNLLFAIHDKSVCFDAVEDKEPTMTKRRTTKFVPSKPISKPQFTTEDGQDVSDADHKPKRTLRKTNYIKLGAPLLRDNGSDDEDVKTKVRKSGFITAVDLFNELEAGDEDETKPKRGAKPAKGKRRPGTKCLSKASIRKVMLMLEEE